MAVILSWMKKEPNKEKVMKSPVSFVSVNRAEGPTNECKAFVYFVGAKPADFDDERGHMEGATFVECKPDKLASEVVGRFIMWGRTAPKTGGYDKCDFKVKWGNGEAYEGRFDMEFGGTDGNESFWASLRRRIEFYACARRPAHFKDNHWKHFCEEAEKNGWKKEMEKVLAECEI